MSNHLHGSCRCRPRRAAPPAGTQLALFRHFPSKEALCCAALQARGGTAGDRPDTLVAAMLQSHAVLVSQRPGVALPLLLPGLDTRP